MCVCIKNCSSLSLSLMFIFSLSREFSICWVFCVVVEQFTLGLFLFELEKERNSRGEKYI